VAYADHVTVIMTNSEDSRHLREAIRIYERATGARLNYGKSKAMEIGAWKNTDLTLDIPYAQEAVENNRRNVDALGQYDPGQSERDADKRA
jgi:hypothetical protein